MHYYLEATISETIERARRLKTRFPTPLRLYLQALAQRCLSLIDENIEGLNTLLNAPEYKDSHNQNIRLKLLRIKIREIDLIENIAVSAISRSNQEDERINKFMQEICREIDYPLLPPTVSGISSDYYQIFPKYNLLLVPLLECEFLLHLPDLYHELAHPLFIERNNSLVEPFQREAADFYRIVVAYFDKQIESDGAASSVYEELKANWSRWLPEFFCDIFGTCTVGAAYAWAHLHLSNKRGGNPFEVTTPNKPTHPNDEARMLVILQLLDFMGLGAQKTAIQEKWMEFHKYNNRQKDNNFDLAYPQKLLESCAMHGFRAVVGTKCNIAPHQKGLIYTTLNEAWEKFWLDYVSFFRWEQERVREIQQTFSR